MVPIEQKDWTEEDRASKLGQNHPLDSTKRRIKKASVLDADRYCLRRGDRKIVSLDAQFSLYVE
jgi:hypothetical protein